MKKLFTLIALGAAALGMQAATTVTWDIASLADYGYQNNDNFDGQTLEVDNTISVSFEMTSAAKEGQYPKYQIKSDTGAIFLQFYSKNTMTVKAKDATITSIKFVVNTDNTPSWKIKEGATAYQEGADTWTGSAASVIFTGNSAASLTSLVITYEAEQAVDPNEIKQANLFFTEDQVAAKGSAEAQNVTLEANNVKISFTSNSTSAQLVANNGYFGTAADYVTYMYAYQPGGKSTQGTASANKGTMTFPADGTLYIYGYNTPSSTEATGRNLQIWYDGAMTWEHFFKTDACETITIPANGTTVLEDIERNIYPVVSAPVKKGTSYLLWPTNQIKMYGFIYVPEGQQLESGIGAIKAAAGSEQAYDVMGRPVNEQTFRGFYIKGGKKYFRK